MHHAPATATCVAVAVAATAAAAAATLTTSLLLLLVHLVESRQRVGVDEAHDAAQCSARRIAHRDGWSALVVAIVTSSLGRRRQHGRSDTARREARALRRVGGAAGGRR